MNARRLATIGAVTAALAGGLASMPASAAPVAAQSAASITAQHEQAADQTGLQRASWRYVWGPSKITKVYFAEHNRKWNSRPYTTNVKNHGVWYTCTKNAYARITIKNVDKNATILDTGLKKCTGNRQTKKATGPYRPGESLRVYISAGNPIPTVKVGAVEKR